MRLSTIAVCLLLVSPPSVLGCIEHSPERTGWFQEVPSSSSQGAWTGVEAMRWDEMPGIWLTGAGSASVVLVLVSFRSFSRAAGRGPMQPTGPAGGDDGDRESRGFRNPGPESRCI